MLIQEKLKNDNHFSNIEKAIAQYLLENQHQIKKASVRFIAEQTYTSPSSIMRFCQKLGFNGYTDFKEAYLEEIHYLSSHFQNIDANFPFMPNDKNMIIANKIETLYVETIKDSLSLLHHDHLQKAANILERAQNIFICSSGISKNIADIFRDNMMRIGKNVISFHGTSNAYYEASYCQNSSCFIIISYSGETQNIIKIASKLKKRKIPTICLTSFGQNTISSLCECHLYISTRQKLISNLGNFAINISILYILDVLYANCFHFHYHSYLNHKIQYSKEWETRISDNPILKESNDK